MNHNHLIALLQEGYTTVGLVFQNAASPTHYSSEPWNHKEYTYKARKDENLVVGDFVIIEAPNKELKVCRVNRVDEDAVLDIGSKKAYKWIIGKVDMTRYHRTLELEKKVAAVLQEAERVNQKRKLIEQFQQDFPEGSRGRQLLNDVLSEFGQLGNDSVFTDAVEAAKELKNA